MVNSRLLLILARQTRYRFGPQLSQCVICRSGRTENLPCVKVFGDDKIEHAREGAIKFVAGHSVKVAHLRQDRLEILNGELTALAHPSSPDSLPIWPAAFAVRHMPLRENGKLTLRQSVRGRQDRTCEG